ncbi:MAG: hypothetical protein J1F05_00455 [Muribaculaceae bacterium]|nr:hypothetical protein [Muribaculaceae bacterium]
MADKKSRRISTLGSRLTSLISVALVLVLLATAALIALTGKNLTDDLRRNLGFIVKMERECNPSDVNILGKALHSHPAVRELAYSSADDILAEESEYLGEEIGNLVDSNPYSSEFDVKVKPEYSTPDSINSLVKRFEQFQGVSEIVTESAVIEGVDASLKRLSTILLCVAVILLIVSIALINNTISLSIYSRRFVIHTMKLVGATASFIRRPFLKAGAVNGLFAGILASLVLVAIRFYASTIDPILEQALPWASVAIICAGIILIGMAICLLTAVFATNRYLKASYDEMFLK